MKGDSHAKKLFKQYVLSENKIDGRSFVKIFRDNNLLTKSFTSIDLDIIFAKNKSKGDRKLTFEQFEKCLKECSDKLKKDYCDLISSFSDNGPVYSGTKTESVKLHDDKTTYTGVYAKGGPSTIDNENGDLSNLLNRKEATVRGINKNWVKNKLEIIYFKLKQHELWKARILMLILELNAQF